VIPLYVIALVGSAIAQPETDFSTSEPAGRRRADRFYTPANQILTPAGLQVELAGMRPQALALSPDGRLLVTAGKTHELVVIDPVAGKIRQHALLPPEPPKTNRPNAQNERILEPDTEGQVSFTGLVFSPDGSRIYLANVDGSIKVFAVEKSGGVKPLVTFPLPPANAPQRKAEIPAGIAVSPDGKRLYVAFNLSNQLAELDASDGHVLRTWEVGVAPCDVILNRAKVYVSNWGGRIPSNSNSRLQAPDNNQTSSPNYSEKFSETVGPAGRGTFVRVDPVRFIASEGSVSVIKLGSSGRHADREILTGLHASALALSPSRRWLTVANAASDTMSVIDTRSDEIIETIWARQNPADLFGAQPNALAFDNSGRRLFACNGSQNAVAVFDFDPGKSKLLGLIPVGWFPGAIVCDTRRNSIYAANIKGFSPGRSRASGKPEFNTHQYHGSISLMKIPSTKVLSSYTRTAMANMRYPLLQKAALPPRAGQPPQPVPARVGESSVFKHVIYIIKENRTYDQVLGDMKEGNGDASLCIFGERVTPNQHKLAREFVLLDNTYCSGILSADGHQWADTAITTDYMEKSFAGFPRSYVDGMADEDVDALAYSPTGFIWDNAIAHGKTLRDYGEFAITELRWKDKSRKDEPTFLDCYREFTNHTGKLEIWSRPAIESLRPYLVTNTVGWELSIPDVFRAAHFIGELKDFERRGDLPNLSIICLPNNHTSGTKAHYPTPEAYVADNDLALGQIVEAISQSRFWPETCIFVIEDDPQNGWDHVSGYRTTAFVVSPYTRRRAVISTQYNQTSVLRTMELILGLPPMNQLDATATPMFDCFTNKADSTPFHSVANNVPLDEMNPEPKRISDPLLRKQAHLSARLPLKKPDQCSEDILNRIIWNAVKGSRVPYPQWAIQMTEAD
jgi:DNA-binding beta-propeller fold protein YncE